jgi:integrase
MSDDHHTTPAPSGKPGKRGKPAPALQPPTPARDKPAKPYPTYPLTAHPAGVWCKKIRGKLHYFGAWDDPDGALANYLEQKDALHAGRKPKETTDGVTVKELANAFLNAKQDKVNSNELSPRTWTDYKEACDLVVSSFSKSRLVEDLDPQDFAALRKKMTKRWGPHRVGKTIQCIRCLFKYGHDAAIIKAVPRYGPDFARPSKKVHRQHRQAQGSKLFTPGEICQLIAKAGPQLKAMVLLGINCGFGNSDCGNLPLSAVDLESGWIDFPRPKTGMPRRCPLWPETVEALKEAIAKRPAPKTPAASDLVFITKYGESWAKDVADSPITKETRKLLNALKINGHRNFYSLRHTFRTVGDATKDQVGVDFIMGHEVPNMSSVYRETVADERLKAVTEHVRQWLFADPEKTKSTPAKSDEEE